MRLARLLPLLLSAALGAADITAYDLRLDLAKDGSGRGSARVTFSSCAPGTFYLPLGFGHLEQLHLDEAPAGVGLEPGPSNGLTNLHVRLPEDVPAQATLRFSFTVRQAFVAVEPGPGERSTLPRGSRLFRHAFVNTQEAPIARYRFEVLFPEGSIAQSIREALPKLKKGEVGPRARLARIDGRQGAVLQFANLKQGDDTSLVLELVPDRKSLGWLLVGVVLSVVYLVFFRDLVFRRET